MDVCEDALRMVEDQILSRGITDTGVIRAMQRIPRHLFVPPGSFSSAYADYPVPIGYGQTISQPYIVALMTEHLSLNGSERVLEVGTGSGYQTAILSLLAKEVFTLEIIKALSEKAESVCTALGCRNIRYRNADGRYGWPEEAPFDGIIVAAAAPKIPRALIEQITEGGVLILPVGPCDGIQELILLRRQGPHISRRSLIDVRFVSMTRRIR